MLHDLPLDNLLPLNVALSPVKPVLLEPPPAHSSAKHILKHYFIIHLCKIITSNHIFTRSKQDIRKLDLSQDIVTSLPKCDTPLPKYQSPTTKIHQIINHIYFYGSNSYVLIRSVLCEMI